jgi:hypothetical protein
MFFKVKIGNVKARGKYSCQCILKAKLYEGFYSEWTIPGRCSCVARS